MPAPRIGVDLVDVETVRRRFDGRSQLLRTVFTSAELAYCEAQAVPWPHLAARFAAKEATLKALGTGLAGTMDWGDIEVMRDATGMPSLVLRNATRHRVTAAGFTQCEVSLSHTDAYAVAVVMLHFA